jgi:hypothetical protein
VRVELDGHADVLGGAASRHAMFDEHPLEMYLSSVVLMAHEVVLLLVLYVFQLFLVVLSSPGELQIPATSS